ncbi:MAG: protein jag [Anaerolineae bacterium]|nr:protein jag [Anaerolineae bacterium]
MERTTLEVIAPSVEEALARGLEQLGVPEDQVELEVLDEGNRGFLGFGARQVRVRLSIKIAGGSDSSQTGSARPQADASVVTDDPLLDFSAQTTRELLAKMKLPARVSAKYGAPDEGGDTPILVDVHGDDLSILIGRRAETLNALQYILGLIISKEAQHWVQVVVDVEGYRARREKQLRQLARRMAEQAVRTGKRQILEPMSSSERRIIHLELRDHPDVTSESIGEDPARKVSILLKNK